MSISAVVVTFNSAGTIERCLISLLSQSIKPDEILVVDNASRDNTIELVATNFPEVKTIQNKENRGFATACNTGIANTDSDFVAMLNPDAWADEKWLENLSKDMSSDDRTAIVGSRILNPDGTTWSAGGKFSYFKPGMAFLIKKDGKKGDRYFVDTCACLIRRSAVTEVGNFDEKFFLNVEDLEWCWRARKAGHRVAYNPEAVARHDAGHSMGRGETYYYWNIRGHLHFIGKHFRGTRKMILRANYKIYLAILKAKFRKRPPILDAIRRAAEDAKNV